MAQSVSVLHLLRLSERPLGTVWECLATSETVWETSWYRRRLFRSLLHRLQLSGRPLVTVWECLAPSETVWETSWHRLGVSGTFRDCL
ncbi:hypothetical protein DPMN_172061 [Dreissena polymorpha]|uniref:Uncharacterized protein n=1 Tax=Dreissena polymorpha TaxID=45954 RepID=A0A9D4E0A5_DREPO|nr:hypothetical protein DPMN_172061 [Dreissena polymorpha]